MDRGVSSQSFKSPLNETGRFVSETFFFLSLLMIWRLLAELNVRMVYRLVFLTLILVSPQYVFWVSDVYDRIDSPILLHNIFISGLSLMWPARMPQDI
jgi:hypothetical protein